MSVTTRAQQKVTKKLLMKLLKEIPVENSSKQFKDVTAHLAGSRQILRHLVMTSSLLPPRADGSVIRKSQLTTALDTGCASSRLHLVLRSLILLLALAMPAWAQTPPDTSLRPVAGSFTEDQVVRGEGVFKATCAACHETSFHTGEQFRFSWYGRTLYDYFKIVKTTMPEDNPGGLPDDDYARVIAYIMKLNGFSAGADSLRSDSLALKRIRIGDSARSP